MIKEIGCFLGFVLMYCAVMAPVWTLSKVCAIIGAVVHVL